MILAILTLVLMIIIHEFGHFAMAKLVHVPVYEFAIGMGPKLFSCYGKSETKYSIRLFPIGGFCSFDKEDVTGIQDTALNKEPIWKRLLILFGGAGFNLISAFIVAVFVCAFIGLPTTSTIVYGIADERTDSFFMPEDEIIAVNGININGEYEILAQELENSDGIVNITVLRTEEGSSKQKKISSDIKLIDYNGEWKMGLNMYSKPVAVKGFKILPASLNYCYETGSSILRSLGGLFNGSVKLNDMSGVVGIVVVMGGAANENIRNILTYFIMISINLGLLNLMPIPVLDGAKIIFCLYEAVFKRKVPEKIEENLTVAFALLLFMLMIYLTLHDLLMLRN